MYFEVKVGENEVKVGETPYYCALQLGALDRLGAVMPHAALQNSPYIEIEHIEVRRAYRRWSPRTHLQRLAMRAEGYEACGLAP